MLRRSNTYLVVARHTLEVRHGMDERIERWGDTAERAGVAPGPTPANAPVRRPSSAPVPTAVGGARNEGFQGCGSGCACAL